MGMGVLSAAQGLAVLHHVFGSAGACNMAASPFDWTRITQSTHPLPPVCAALCAEAADLAAAAAAAAGTDDAAGAGAGAGVAAGAGAAGPVRGAGAGAAVAVHAKAVPRVHEIREVIARMAVDLAGKEIGADEPLMSAGLNSLAGTELKSAIDATFGLDLPGTVVYDYPSIGALATLVYTELGGGTDDAVAMAGGAGLEPRHPYTASGRVLVVVTRG